MIFRVCEHYDDKQVVYKLSQDTECFICYEINTINEQQPINMQNQHLYLKNCKCNGVIHIHCLNLWFDKNKSCPICRNNMIKNERTKSILFYFIPKSYYFYNKFKSFSIKVLKFIFIFFIFYSIIDFYLLVLKNKYHSNSSLYKEEQQSNLLDKL